MDKKIEDRWSKDDDIIFRQRIEIARLTQGWGESDLKLEAIIIEMEQVEADHAKAIEAAYMAGQADCGADPSYSSAQAYASLHKESK